MGHDESAGYVSTHITLKGFPMYRRLFAQIGTAVAMVAFAAPDGVADEIVGQEPSNRKAGQRDAESTTVELKLASGQAKEVEVALGQSAREVLTRLKPAPAAADDDPWLLYMAAGGGHYVLFFCAEGAAREMQGRLDPGRDKLCAVVHYPTESPVDGKFLLPKKMRGKTAGDFVTLKVRVGPQRARVATAALGMTAKDVMHLYRPARDRAEEDDAIVFDSIDDGGRYLLVFSSRADGDKLKSLSEVVYWPGGQKESLVLLPRDKRGEPVPAAQQAILESHASDTATD